MDAAARNNALDKLTWRALWWFRWAAAATVVFGLLIIAVSAAATVYDGDFWITARAGVTLLLGILMGIIDVLQRVDGDLAEPADRHRQRPQRAGRRRSRIPNAAAAGRAGAMASRQNTIFSLPLLVFMVGASHFYNVGPLRDQTLGRREVGSLLPRRHRDHRGARG